MRWIIDGNNVVGSRPDGWWRDRTAGYVRLLDEVQRWHAEVGHPATIVFDGYPSTRLPEGTWAGVEVRYAHDDRADAADDAIVALVAQRRAEEEEPTTVVTADRRLAERVSRRLGADVEGPRTFRDRVADIAPRRSDRAVLAHFGIDETALVGRGGEARIFAVDDERVLRLPHAADPHLEDRRGLLDAIRGASPIPVPEVLDVLDVEGRSVLVERRLRGRPAAEVLAAEGTDREALVRDHLDVVARIALLPCPADAFGELWGHDAIAATTFASWAEQRLGRNLVRGGDRFAHVDPAVVAGELVDALGHDDTRIPVLVHLDAFLGNQLADGDRVTALLDFGPTCAGGVPDLDPLTCVHYLDEDITPQATAADRAVAREWAAEHGLGGAVDPARRFIAAYWAGAPDDERLRAWCTQILC